MIIIIFFFFSYCNSSAFN